MLARLRIWTEDAHIKVDAFGRVDESVVADLLGVTVKTLRNKRSDLWGPPYFKTSSAVLYSLEDIAAYLASQRVVPESSRRVLAQ